MGQGASSPTAPPPPEPPAVVVPPVPSNTYLRHTTLAPRPKLILLGDSITEQGSSHHHGWVASLAIRYNRRADVVNRGANGYNSLWGAAALQWILEDVLGPKAADGDGEAVAECTGNETSYPQYTFIIGYGANDSCLPDGAHARHHVPLEEYASNLRGMVDTIQTWNAQKNVAVALVTPPPCDTEMQKESRHNENVTRLYADACIEVAREEEVPVVDAWRGMQLPLAKNATGEDASSFERRRQWKEDYLSDGLHLSPLGNYRLYELVVDVLDRSRQEEGGRGLGLAATQLPRGFPDHSTVEAEDLAKTFANIGGPVGNKT
ncbi:hypothetical protein ACHAXT_009672 [Thalassiosira profunda]